MAEEDILPIQLFLRGINALLVAVRELMIYSLHPVAQLTLKASAGLQHKDRNGSTFDHIKMSVYVSVSTAQTVNTTCEHISTILLCRLRLLLYPDTIQGCVNSQCKINDNQSKMG